MVFRPSLPPNHSKTTRILPLCFAATLLLAWENTGGTLPMPPARLKPIPPAPRRNMSRRERPVSDNGFFLVMRRCLRDGSDGSIVVRIGECKTAVHKKVHLEA